MCGVRVHAVLLQTERVAGEEHDHRTTSRTNLVDLAGSERCGSAQTSGEQLKVRAPLAPRGLLRAVGGGGARASHTQPDDVRLRLRRVDRTAVISGQIRTFSVTMTFQRA